MKSGKKKFSIPLVVNVGFPVKIYEIVIKADSASEALKIAREQMPFKTVQVEIGQSIIESKE